MQDRDLIYRGILAGEALRDRYGVLKYIKAQGQLEEYAAWAADQLLANWFSK